jgi:DNA-binding NtrC family response regulator
MSDASKPSVLVVDDKENMLKLFSRILGDAYAVTTAADGERALALVAAREFDVVVTDIQMPGADGFAVLREVKRRAPATEVVLVTAYASIPKAVEAMREGAYDYLAKPFDPDEVALVVARALERRRQRREAEGLKERLASAPDFHGLLGTSAAIRQACALLAQGAARDFTVLLTGETGTGKELAARAVHAESPRRGGPFVAVNCGALPAELVESELFGHAKGAFTGATSAKTGLFEEAQGGTLFLDEVGDLPAPMQVKLNRALQEKEVRRVGENASRKVDVRVVAATNRLLLEEVNAGRFRQDLYYRLRVIELRVPPLRERREDILPLARLLLVEATERLGRRVLSFAPEAADQLLRYAWPGNVRELGNAIERAVALCEGTRVERDDLPEEVREAPPSFLPGASPRRLEDMEREYILAVLARNEGNRSRTAEQLDIGLATLYRKLKQYGHPEAPH